MSEIEAINLLSYSKPLATLLAIDNSYVLTMTDLIKLYGVEQVLEAGFTKNARILSAAGLRRFDLAILLGALFLSSYRSQLLPLGFFQAQG